MLLLVEFITLLSFVVVTYKIMSLMIPHADSFAFSHFYFGLLLIVTVSSYISKRRCRAVENSAEMVKSRSIRRNQLLFPYNE